MADRKNNRRRGATLTVAGYRKLQAARTAAELAANDGDRYTKEELSTFTGLSIKTLTKIFDRASDLDTENATPVDKQTLYICFAAFNLVLERHDYFYPQSIVLPVGTLHVGVGDSLPLGTASPLAIQTGSANEPSDLEQPDLRDDRVTLDLPTRYSPINSDWGEAPDVSVFYGRVAELTKLATWINTDRCKLVILLGMGGIGKTALATKLAQQLQPHFATIVWRSLRHAPPLQTLLPELIQILSRQAKIVAPTVAISTQISHLLEYLRQERCLLVLDNAEAIIQSQSSTESHHPEYPGYAELFQRIGSSPHQSCLVVTSREKPAAIVPLEGEKLPVRSINIAGLNVGESEDLFEAKGLSSSSSDDRERLQQIYSGNPLALNIVATAIYDLFDGEIDKFLAAETIIFSDIRQLLDQQFDRISPTEQMVMHCLAIERNWLSLDDLHDRLLPNTTKPRLLGALESLGRRSLIERSRGKFTQQAVVMEYTTARTIDRIVCELTNWEIQIDKLPALPLWLSYPLLAADSPKYIHAIQTRLILEPIASQLQLQFGRKLLIQHFQSILTSLQTDYRGTLHYGAGNLINLFRHLNIDLTGYNFADLPILQVSFQGAILHNVNFSGANLSKSIFTDNFGRVFATAFSPDSQLVAVGEYNGDVYIWQVATKRLQFKFQGHSSWIWSLAFSPDGRILASASQDGTIRLWEIATGQVSHVLQADNYRVLSLSFSPYMVDLASGAAYMLATAHGDGALRWWNVATGELIRTRSHHPQQQVYSVRFSPDGNLLATGCGDGTVKIWDGSTGECLHTFTEHTKRVWSVRFSPNGRLLATCSGDGTIRIWACPGGEASPLAIRSRSDVATWTVVRVLTGYRDWFFAIEFSPDSQLLAVGNVGNVVKILNLQTDKHIATLTAHTSWVSTLNFSPVSAKRRLSFGTLRERQRGASPGENGQLLITASGDRNVCLWDTTTWQELYRWQGYSNWIESVAFHPGGTKLITGSLDGMVREWDLQHQQPIQTFTGHQMSVWSVDYSPDGRSIVSGSSDSTVKLWNAELGNLVKTFSVGQGEVCRVKFSPDGRLIAGVAENTGVCLWSVTGELLATLSGGTNLVRSISFSPNSQLLATASFDACWRLWDVQTSQLLSCYTGHTNWIWDVAFSPDGRSVATCSADLTVRLWACPVGEASPLAIRSRGDVATGNCLQILEGHSLEILSVKFSPNGQYLATGSADSTINIWKIETGQVVQTLTGHLDRVLCVSYSPDGNLLASSSSDETIKLWDLATGECLNTYKPLPPYAGMDITGATGLSAATLESLQTLGAIVNGVNPSEPRTI